MGSYVPNTKEQRQEMLKEIGFQTIDDLFAHIPAEVKIQGGLNIPEGKTELEVRRDMENIAAKNQVFKTIFRGAGAYRHFIPATVKSVISKENLLTAYTPYQAEISQGLLQSIFEYQTMICELTGMDASNASVYDSATAAAKAAAMCRDRKRGTHLCQCFRGPEDPLCDPHLLLWFRCTSCGPSGKRRSHRSGKLEFYGYLFHCLPDHSDYKLLRTCGRRS